MSSRSANKMGEFLSRFDAAKFPGFFGLWL